MLILVVASGLLIFVVTVRFGFFWLQLPVIFILLVSGYSPK